MSSQNRVVLVVDQNSVAFLWVTQCCICCGSRSVVLFDVGQTSVRFVFVGEGVEKVLYCLLKQCFVCC